MTIGSFSNLRDADILNIIEFQASNLARWAALVFFGKNPFLRTQPIDMAQSVGCNPGQVQNELEALAQMGILIARKNGLQMSYALAPEPAVRRAVIHFAERSLFD